MYVSMYVCIYRESSLYVYIYIYIHTHICVSMYIYVYIQRDLVDCGLWIINFKNDINHSLFVLIDCGELHAKEGGELRTRVERSECWWRLVEI